MDVVARRRCSMRTPRPRAVSAAFGFLCARRACRRGRQRCEIGIVYLHSVRGAPPPTGVSTIPGRSLAVIPLGNSLLCFIQSALQIAHVHCIPLYNDVFGGQRFFASSPEPPPPPPRSSAGVEPTPVTSAAASDERL